MGHRGELDVLPRLMDGMMLQPESLRLFGRKNGEQITAVYRLAYAYLQQPCRIY